VQGVWTLNLGQALAPGIYNIVAESTDAAGKVAADATTAEIYVKSPPPAPPPPPYDCAGMLAKIGSIFPIRFDFNQTSLKSPYDLALKQYAALLKDARCDSVKAQISGHADIFGPRLYNQALSEARAQAVVAMLSGDGVDAARLSIAGFSELTPVDPEPSIPARKKNRRVEITLMK
jgi:outer membrane protein OmpA-like peptidoglycan-associated protein